MGRQSLNKIVRRNNRLLGSISAVWLRPRRVWHPVTWPRSRMQRPVEAGEVPEPNEFGPVVAAPVVRPLIGDRWPRDQKYVVDRHYTVLVVGVGSHRTLIAEGVSVGVDVRRLAVL